MSEQMALDLRRELRVGDVVRMPGMGRYKPRYWRIVWADQHELRVHAYPCGNQVHRSTRCTWERDATLMWHERPVVMRREPATETRCSREYVDWEAS